MPSSAETHIQKRRRAACGNGQRHACQIAAAHARRKAGTERLKEVNPPGCG
jgi:hypothetical protein